MKEIDCPACKVARAPETWPCPNPSCSRWVQRFRYDRLGVSHISREYIGTTQHFWYWESTGVLGIAMSPLPPSGNVAGLDTAGTTE